MNTNDHLLQTSFQHRSLRRHAHTAATPTGKPARFSADFDGDDRLDAFLRGLLIVCVLVSVMICGLHLNVIGRPHAAPLPVPAAAVEVTAARPVTTPTAPTASIL